MGVFHDSSYKQRNCLFPCIYKPWTLYYNMASLPSRESIWSSMLAARQLSVTYYTLSTCLTDLLHRYIEITSSQNNKISSSLFYSLDQTLFSSSITPANQSKLLDDYSNILVNILKWVKQNVSFILLFYRKMFLSPTFRVWIMDDVKKMSQTYFLLIINNLFLSL